MESAAGVWVLGRSLLEKLFVFWLVEFKIIKKLRAIGTLVEEGSLKKQNPARTEIWFEATELCKKIQKI